MSKVPTKQVNTRCRTVMHDQDHHLIVLASLAHYGVILLDFSAEQRTQITGSASPSNQPKATHNSVQVFPAIRYLARVLEVMCVDSIQELRGERQKGTGCKPKEEMFFPGHRRGREGVLRCGRFVSPCTPVLLRNLSLFWLGDTTRPCGTTKCGKRR